MSEDTSMEQKISRYQRFVKGPKCGRVYVSNLPFKMQRQQIIDLFNTVTRVFSVYMAMNGGSFKGYAFVSVEDQDKAKELDGIDIGGRNITVHEAIRREEYVQAVKRVIHGNTEETPREKPSEKDH